MRICHIVDELRIGGLERTIVGIVTRLSGHTHEVWCLTRKGALAADVEKAGVTVREFGFSAKMTPASLTALVAAMKAGRFDIVHSHGAHPAMWGEAAALLAGVSVRIDHAQNLFRFFPFNQRIRLKILSCFATKIVAVSDAVKRSLIDTVWIDPRKIEVIYNSAPDLAVEGERSRSEIRRSMGLPAGDTVIGSVGRLERCKGHAYLLDAIARVLQRGLSCACVIVGDGPEMDALRSRARRLGLGAHAVFTGWRRDIGDLMCAMDAYVQPSTLIEGLPLALAEAASCSLPLIATDIGGNREIVSDGVNGYIVPPEDAGALAERIGRLASDPALAGPMGRASRSAWQERFNQDLMIRRVADLYDRYGKK